MSITDDDMARWAHELRTAPPPKPQEPTTPADDDGGGDGFHIGVHIATPTGTRYHSSVELPGVLTAPSALIKAAVVQAAAGVLAQLGISSTTVAITHPGPCSDPACTACTRRRAGGS